MVWLRNCRRTHSSLLWQANNNEALSTTTTVHWRARKITGPSHALIRVLGGQCLQHMLDERQVVACHGDFPAVCDTAVGQVHEAIPPVLPRREQLVRGATDVRLAHHRLQVRQGDVWAQVALEATQRFA